MREFFNSLRPAIACGLSVVAAGTSAASAHAPCQPPVFLELDISTTFEYPAEVQQGDIFPVYVRIQNNSDQTIEAPLPSSVLMRSDADLFYFSDFCRMHCLFAQSRMIAPGGSVLLHMGDVYTNHSGLSEGQVGYGDARLAGLTEDGQLYAIDIEDTLPVTITPVTGLPDPVVPPPRQPLELSEDQKVVRDPDTGYDWLRFNNTVGITKEELYSRLQPGGDLHGFNIASRYQVQTLIQNHLAAAGVASVRFELDDFIGGAARTPLQNLVQLLQPTGETEKKFFISGVVSDANPLLDNQPRFTTLTLYGDKTLDTIWFSSPFGLHAQVIDEPTLLDDSAETGVWLVRGAPVNEQRHPGNARYTSDYLFLPNVVIDGNSYRVDLFRKEGTVPSFVVTDMRNSLPEDLTKPAVVFDAATGRLRADNVEVVTELPAGDYDLELELVPGTDPYLTRLIDAIPVAD